MTTTSGKEINLSDVIKESATKRYSYLKTIEERLGTDMLSAEEKSTLEYLHDYFINKKICITNK